MQFEVHTNPRPSFHPGLMEEDRTLLEIAFIPAAPRVFSPRRASRFHIDWVAVGAGAFVYAVAFAAWFLLAR